MGHPNCLPADRKLAAYILCDTLEYCGESTAPVLPHIMPALFAACDSDEPSLRQPAAYGLSVAAAGLPMAFGQGPQYLEQALQHLCAATQLPNARQGAQESATDNVVAAIGQICLHHGAHPVLQRDGDQLWNLYLGYLPMKGDQEEAAKVMMQLAQIARSGDPNVVGNGVERLGRMVALLAGSVGEAGTTDTMHQEIAVSIGHLQATLPPESLQAIWGGLDAGLQERLRQLMEQAAGHAAS